MQKLEPRIRTSALISPSASLLHSDSFNNSIGYSGTLITENGTTSPWQAGIRIGDLPGPSIDVKIADAANAIEADILSPSIGTLNSMPFTTQAMIARAHELKMQVIPWTVRDCLK